MAIVSVSRAAKSVLSVIDIDENSRDVCFEGKILNWCGTFDYLRSGIKRGSSSTSYPCLHCDLINKECLTTVTMTIAGDVIHHHEEKICRGAYVRVENFEVKKNILRDFRREICLKHC